jgi:uncharacterized protein (DUF58 family)
MAFADWARIERASAAGRAEVGARRIYILPTRFGMLFGGLLVLMLLGAVNYANNPAHLLTFLLGALGANAIYQTWRNLHGLTITCLGVEPVFAGQAAYFRIDCDGAGAAQERPGLQFEFDSSQPLLTDVSSSSGAAQLAIPLAARPRGRYPVGRLTISTRYPLGLFRAWCYVACGRELLVYPKPGAAWLPPGHSGQLTSGGEDGTGNDDFVGLRNYIPGDAPSRIDWKSLARDRGLNTRLFSGQAAAPMWLDFSDAPGRDDEARLGSLARAVLDAEAAQRRYGLRLPGVEVHPGLGHEHRARCLRYLAIYGITDA